MAKKLYLKNLLGELSLDRALLQILDQPYLKDLASRLKETEAVQEIFKKLQKEESIMDWMDYDQLMNLREVTIPQMLIKESGLEEPGSLPGEIGTTFDEQFEDILGPLPKKKFAKGGIKGSFIKNILGTLIDEFSERLGVEGPVFDENPQAYTRDIANWIRLNVGDEFFFHPKIADSIKGTLMHVDQVDLGMEAGKKHYPDIMETAMEKYPQFSGVGDDLSKLGIEQEDLRNALGSAYSTAHTFKEILNAMEKAIKYQKTFGDDLPKNARGGIAALQEGGEFGDVVEWITGDFKGKKYTRDWNKLTKEQQEIWKEAMRKKHGKDYKGDYIPFRNYSYWNPETEGYQDTPVTEEQWANEPHILKQRREHKEVTPYGYDSPKAWKEVLKQLGLDEGEWWKAYGEGNIPGVHGPVGGVLHTLTAPMDAYERNAEEWSAQTGRPVKFLNEMAGGLGVGLPIGYAGSYGIGALIRKFGSAKVAQMMAEAFPLTMSKKGLLSLSNWKKSLWRNPKELMKLHWTNWSKGIPGQILKKLAPSAAAKFGAGSLAGPAGWTAAAGLTAWDAYRIYKWLQEGQQEKKEIEALSE